MLPSFQCIVLWLCKQWPQTKLFNPVAHRVRELSEVNVLFFFNKGIVLTEKTEVDSNYCLQIFIATDLPGDPDNNINTVFCFTYISDVVLTVWGQVLLANKITSE